LWLIIFFISILGSVFYSLLFHDFFQVKEIKVSGNQKVKREFIEEKIFNLIEKEILSFSSKSIFLINSANIQEVLLNSFPYLDDVDLNREFPDILIIEVEERKPVAVFNQDQKYFLIDKKGVIFEEITEGESGYLKIKRLSLDSPLDLGQGVVSEEEISKILEIDSKLKRDLSIQCQRVNIVSEERINFQTSEGWEIYLNPKGDIDWQLTKLRVDLEQEIPPENRSNLEYIELRFGNFAPYKYKTLPEDDSTQSNR
jgi:cell division protein FtsQ